MKLLFAFILVFLNLGIAAEFGETAYDIDIDVDIVQLTDTAENVDTAWLETNDFDLTTQREYRSPVQDNVLTTKPQGCDSSCERKVEIMINNTLPVEADFLLRHRHCNVNESHVFYKIPPGGQSAWYPYPVEMLRTDYDYWELVIRFPKPGWRLKSGFKNCWFNFRTYELPRMITVYRDRWDITSEGRVVCKNYTLNTRDYMPAAPRGYYLNSYMFVQVNNKMGSTASVAVELDPGRPSPVGQNFTTFLGNGEKVKPVTFFFESNSTKSRSESWRFTVSNADGTVRSQDQYCKLSTSDAGLLKTLTVDRNGWQLGQHCSGDWHGKKSTDVDPMFLAGLHGDL